MLAIGIIGGVIDAAPAFTGKELTIPLWGWIAIALVGIPIAQFLAYNKVAKQRDNLSAQLDLVRDELKAMKRKENIAEGGLKMNKSELGYLGLRVWWVTNPPRQGERYPVANIDEAITKLDELVERDLARGDAVFANAGGLEYQFQDEDGEWVEFYDEEGRDIDQIIADRAEV